MPRIPIKQAGEGSARAGRTATPMPTFAPAATSTPPVKRSKAIGAGTAQDQALGDLGRILQGAAKDVKAVQNNIVTRREFKERQQADSLVSAARLHWSKYTREAEQNPSSGMVDQFTNDFNSYTEQVKSQVEGFEFEHNKAELEEKFAAIEEAALARVFGTQARFNTESAISEFGNQIQDGIDFIANTNNPDDLIAVQQELLDGLDALEENHLKDDPQRVASFKRVIDGMSANFVEHILKDDPQMAQTILDESKNISLPKRTQLERQINLADDSQDRELKVQQRNIYTSALEHIYNHGEIPAYWDEESFALEMGSDALASAKRGLEAEFKFYELKSKMQAASLEELEAVKNEVQTKQGTVETDEDRQLRKRVFDYAKNQENEMRRDPALYALQDPFLNEAYKNWKENPQLIGSPEVAGSVIEGIKAFQRTKLGLKEHQIQPLPLEDAKKHASVINSAKPQNVEAAMSELETIYGPRFDEVWQQVASADEEDRVDDRYQLILFGVNKKWKNEYIAALQTEKFNIGDTQDNNIDKLIGGDSTLSDNDTLNSFQDALLLADPSADMQKRILNWKSAVGTYAKHLLSTRQVSNEEKAVEVAADRLIGETYSFGEVDGKTFAIPREIIGKDEVIDVEIGAKRIKRGIDPDRVDFSQFEFMFLGITGETLRETKRDAIDEMFFLTSPDNRSLMLYMESDVSQKGFSGRVHPVLDVDGDFITFNFHDVRNTANVDTRLQREFKEETKKSKKRSSSTNRADVLQAVQRTQDLTPGLIDTF